MAQIMCSVNNCNYWDQGNICQASQIFVTGDKYAEQMPDRFDAPKASSAKPTPANRCEETACKTFVTKGSEKVREDSVVRRS